MATSKLFTVAGTAKNASGVTTVRFANDLVSRVKCLSKGTSTDVNLLELPHPMTKLQACQYLAANGFTEGDVGFVVASKVAQYSKEAKRGEVKVAAKTPAKAKKAEPVVE
jgi:hypothetical protein